MDEDEQTPEELEVLFGSGSAIEAAYVWINLIVAGDLRGAWPLTDPTFRLVIAQNAVWANRHDPAIAAYDRESAAESLAGLSFDYDLWPGFEQLQLRTLGVAWEGFDRGAWGAASRPRPVPPDLALVLFQNTGGEIVVYEEPTLAVMQPVLLRHTADGWMVCALSDQLTTPGWPPDIPEPWLPGPS